MIFIAVGLFFVMSAVIMAEFFVLILMGKIVKLKPSKESYEAFNTLQKYYK
jgi:hypothetical protein